MSKKVTRERNILVEEIVALLIGALVVGAVVGGWIYFYGGNGEDGGEIGNEEQTQALDLE